MEWNFATADYAAPTNADWIRLIWTKKKFRIIQF